jgi:probable addiction module antidote protein
MANKLSEFDTSAYLDSEETIAEYLKAAREDPNPEVFLAAINHVAKARTRYLEERAKRGSREKFLAVLAKVPSGASDPGDEL